MRQRKQKFVVVLAREQSPWITPEGKLVEFMDEIAVVGPFNSRERAEARANTIRREALKWEDPDGVVGPDNAIHVNVDGLVRGTVSAGDALAVLYHSMPAEAA